MLNDTTAVPLVSQDAEQSHGERTANLLFAIFGTGALAAVTGIVGVGLAWMRRRLGLQEQLMVEHQERVHQRFDEIDGNVQGLQRDNVATYEGLERLQVKTALSLLGTTRVLDTQSNNPTLAPTDSTDGPPSNAPPTYQSSEIQYATQAQVETMSRSPETRAIASVIDRDIARDPDVAQMALDTDAQIGTTPEATLIANELDAGIALARTQQGEIGSADLFTTKVEEFDKRYGITDEHYERQLELAREAWKVIEEVETEAGGETPGTKNLKRELVRHQKDLDTHRNIQKLKDKRSSTDSQDSLAKAHSSLSNAKNTREETQTLIDRSNKSMERCEELLARSSELRARREKYKPETTSSFEQSLAKTEESLRKTIDSNTKFVDSCDKLINKSKDLRRQNARILARKDDYSNPAKLYYPPLDDRSTDNSDNELDTAFMFLEVEAPVSLPRKYSTISDIRKRQRYAAYGREHRKDDVIPSDMSPIEEMKELESHAKASSSTTLEWDMCPLPEPAIMENKKLDVEFEDVPPLELGSLTSINSFTLQPSCEQSGLNSGRLDISLEDISPIIPHHSRDQALHGSDEAMSTKIGLCTHCEDSKGKRLKPEGADNEAHIPSVVEVHIDDVVTMREVADHLNLLTEKLDDEDPEIKKLTAIIKPLCSSDGDISRTTSSTITERNRSQTPSGTIRSAFSSARSLHESTETQQLLHDMATTYV